MQLQWYKILFDKLKKENKGIPPSGPIDSQIYVLGDFATERDVLVGKPFSGESGEIFKTILEYLKINPEKIRYNVAVNFKTEDKEGPSDIQINECREEVFKDVTLTKPKVIVACGNQALKCLFERSEPGIFGWRGHLVPSHKFNCWVVPVFPMRTILKDGISDNKIQWTKGTNHTDTLRVLREDLSIVLDLIKFPVPEVKPYKIVKLKQFNEVLAFLEDINKKDFFMLDFETLGLKPYFKESCILSISFSFDDKTAYTFPVSYFDYSKKKFWDTQQEQTILNRLKVVLTNPKNVKGIHNSVFEMEWSKAILGIDITNIEDSMLQKYILDCRTGTMNMDFLTFVNYGISHKIYPNSIMSNLTQLPIDDLLDYNGKDTIFEYRIYKMQEKQLKKNEILYTVYKEQLETAKTIAQMQFDGACTNAESREKLLIGYKNNRESLEKELLNLDSVKEFRNKYGKVPALKSNSKDIPRILFGIEGLDPFKKTDKGNLSVDKEVLSIYSDKSEFCELLLKYREFSGIEGKVLKSYTECVFPDEKYHTSFFPVETGRLSAKNINLQNLDKRKHPEIRQIIVAPEGFVLIIFDYAQLEARVLAALSNCRSFIEMIKNNYDIHMAKAIEIWSEEIIKNATEKEVKLMRYRAKNEFVFPSFYGAKPPATAKRLAISESKAEQLLQKLWHDFPEILEWQQEILKIYDKKRFVEIPPGRRRYAPLTTNEILNTPVQGGAASIVCKAMNTLSRRSLWLYLNCHDELVACVKEKEAKYVIEEMQTVMETKQYDFLLDTPLVVEGSCGFDWYNTFPVKEILK